MTYTTYTQQALFSSFVEEQTVGSEELKVVEISFYDHEIRAGQKLIASISYDHADFVTQPWLVMVNDEEIHRANTWAKCRSFITWHHTQGTLPVQQPKASSTTGNKIKADVANECEKFGFELLDNGIYHRDVKLGEVGCTDGQWWFIPASSVHQQKVPCDSAFDAVLSLSIDEADTAGVRASARELGVGGGMIEIIVNYVFQEQENGFCRYPLISDVISHTWSGYVQIAVASPLACPLHPPIWNAKDYERVSLYLYGNMVEWH